MSQRPFKSLDATNEDLVSAMSIGPPFCTSMEKIMKRSYISASAAIALGTALFASTAFAIPTDCIVSDVMSATGGNGQVNVAVNGSTVTLTGYADNASVAYAARRAALQHDEIDRVIDLISRN